MLNLIRGHQHLAEAQREGLDGGLIRGAEPYVRRSAPDDVAGVVLVRGTERSVVPGAT